MNASETLFMTEIEGEKIIADIQGNVYGMGYTKEDCIDDAIEHGICEEDLECFTTDYNCLEDEWYDDDEEDY